MSSKYLFGFVMTPSIFWIFHIPIFPIYGLIHLSWFKKHYQVLLDFLTIKNDETVLKTSNNFDSWGRKMFDFRVWWAEKSDHDIHKGKTDCFQETIVHIDMFSNSTPHWADKILSNQRQPSRSGWVEGFLRFSLPAASHPFVGPLYLKTYLQWCASIAEFAMKALQQLLFLFLSLIWQAWHIDIGTRNFWVFQDSSHLWGSSAFHHKTLLLLFRTQSILYPLLFITEHNNIQHTQRFALQSPHNHSVMSDRQGAQLHERKMQALLINELLKKGFQNMSDRANVPTSSSCATVPLPKRGEK